MRLLIIGAGKMGRAVETLAREAGHKVVAVLASADNVAGKGILKAPVADVAIEFTQPDEAARNAITCIECGIPVVVGTTGWYEDRVAVEQRARELGGALFISHNFSLGVALASEIARSAGRSFSRHRQFGAAIVEVHHAAKKDAPSGTAQAIAEAVRETLGREVPISSVRVGSAPGTHTLIFDGPFEQIVITHEARDRRVFADGALRAAEWLVGRVGVFTMHDLMTGNLR